MKKKLIFISMLLTLMFCTCLFPTTVMAGNIGTNIPNLGLGSSISQGNQFQSGKYYTINADGKTVTETEDTENYNIFCEIKDDDSVYLTLKNAVLKDSLYVPGNTTIELIGTNSSNSSVGIQVQTAGDLTLTGSGSLDITSTAESILNKRGACTVDGVTLTLNNGAFALNIDGDLTVHNAVITTTGSQPALDSGKGNVIISGSSQVTATGQIDASEKVIIKDSANVRAEMTGGSIAVNSNYGVEVLDNAYLYASGTTGINSFYGSIVIDGTVDAIATGKQSAAISVGLGDREDRYELKVTGKLTANGYVGLGIMKGDIIIDGGDVQVGTTNPSGLIGIYVMQSGNLEIKNGASVKINSAAHGMGANGGALTIADSTVEITRGSGESYRTFLNRPTIIFTGNGAELDTGSTAADIQKQFVTDEITTETYTGNAYVKIQAHDHAINSVSEQNATCTENGLKAHWECGVCNKLFSDENGTTEISLEDIIIPKTEHVYKDGNCTICGGVDSDYKPSTPNKSDASSKAGSGKTSPQTGDANHIAMWFTLLLAAGATLTGTMVYSAKRRRRV